MPEESTLKNISLRSPRILKSMRDFNSKPSFKSIWSTGSKNITVEARTTGIYAFLTIRVKVKEKTPQNNVQKNTASNCPVSSLKFKKSASTIISNIMPRKKEGKITANTIKETTINFEIRKYSLLEKTVYINTAFDSYSLKHK
jgi:hypothetical protein